MAAAIFSKKKKEAEGYVVDFFFGQKYVVDLFLTPYSDRIRLGIGSRDFCVYIT